MRCAVQHSPVYFARHVAATSDRQRTSGLKFAVDSHDKVLIGSSKLTNVCEHVLQCLHTDVPSYCGTLCALGAHVQGNYNFVRSQFSKFCSHSTYRVGEFHARISPSWKPVCLKLEKMIFFGFNELSTAFSELEESELHRPRYPCIAMYIVAPSVSLSLDPGKGRYTCSTISSPVQR